MKEVDLEKTAWFIRTEKIIYFIVLGLVAFFPHNLVSKINLRFFIVHYTQYDDAEFLQIMALIMILSFSLIVALVINLLNKPEKANTIRAFAWFLFFMFLAVGLAIVLSGVKVTSFYLLIVSYGFINLMSDHFVMKTYKTLWLSTLFIVLPAVLLLMGFPKLLLALSVIMRIFEQIYHRYKPDPDSQKDLK